MPTEPTRLSGQTSPDLEFNSAGRVVEIVNPRGQAIDLTYSADGSAPGHHYRRQFPSAR